MNDNATSTELNSSTTVRNSVSAFMKLFRISNAPTVFTNTLVGASVAAMMEPGSFAHLTHFAAVAIGVLLIYCAGMAINDYFDQVIDAHERPTRPIPAGHISAGAALLWGMSLLVLGVIACALASLDVLPWVMLLASAVLAYNMLHLARFTGPLLMGMCRSLIPVIAAIALSPNQTPAWNILLFFALPLGLATAGISLAARNEMTSIQINTPRRAKRTLVATAFIGLSALAPLGAIATRTLNPMSDFLVLTYIVAIALAGYAIFRGLNLLLRPGSAHKGVMTWISALALMDAASLCILNQPVLAYIAIGCFILTALLQRRVAGS